MPEINYLEPSYGKFTGQVIFVLIIAAIIIRLSIPIPAHSSSRYESAIHYLEKTIPDFSVEDEITIGLVNIADYISEMRKENY